MRAYTPVISKQQSCNLRRIAWAFGIPMTKAMSFSLEFISSLFDKDQICSGCRDKSKCETCYFSNKTESDFPEKKLVMEKESFHLIERQLS